MNFHTERLLPILQVQKPRFLALRSKSLIAPSLPALRKYAHVVLPSENTAPQATPRLRAAAETLLPSLSDLFLFTMASSASFRRKLCLPTFVSKSKPAQQHITFGDPDFFNGITHATRVVEALHAEHPHPTYDVTIKVDTLCSVTLTLSRYSRSNWMPLHHQRRQNHSTIDSSAQTRKRSHSSRFLSRP